MTDTRIRFQEVLSTDEEIEAIIGRPHPFVVAKVTPAIDEISKDFIGRSPFVLVASSDKGGNFDISPKGDPAGFVRILDQHTLAIPERPGNKRADTFHNVLENPKVGLIFLIPGKRETLRVNGSALVVRDLSLRESMALDGKLPSLALVVSVREVFMHCAKCIMRSHLWEPTLWPSLDGLASHAQATIAHGKLDFPLSDLEDLIQNNLRTQLY